MVWYWSFRPIFYSSYNNVIEKQYSGQKIKQPNGSESILLPGSICKYTLAGNECAWINNDAKQIDNICNEGISFPLQDKKVMILVIFQNWSLGHIVSFNCTVITFPFFYTST